MVIALMVLCGLCFFGCVLFAGLAGVDIVFEEWPSVLLFLLVSLACLVGVGLTSAAAAWLAIV